MSQKIKLLLFATLFSIPIYAIEVNHTDEILNHAIEATQTMQVEMSEAINSSVEIIEAVSEPIIESLIETEIMPPEPIIETIIEPQIPPTPSIVESPILIPVVIEDINETVEPTPLEEKIITEKAITETPLSTPESNTTKNPQPITEDKGNVVAGKNIFKYVLKTDCGITGHKFANKYSKEEWEEIAELHKFKETIFETCPNVKRYYQDKWTVDLYKFLHEMSDEDGIPEC